MMCFCNRDKLHLNAKFDVILMLTGVDTPSLVASWLGAWAGEGKVHGPNPGPAHLIFLGFPPLCFPLPLEH